MMRKPLLILLALIALPAHADITFVGASACAIDSDGLVDATPHASTAEDDVILAIVGAANDDVSLSASGYTQIAREHAGPGAPDRNTALMYKVAGASEGATEFGNASTSTIGVLLVTLRGVEIPDPLDVTYSSEDHYVIDTSNDPNATPAPITTNTDGAWVLIGTHMNGYGYDGDINHPSGYTGLGECIGMSYQHAQLLWAAKEVDPAGTETPGTPTHDFDASQNNDPVLFTIALAPAEEVGGGGSPLRRRRD